MILHKRFSLKYSLRPLDLDASRRKVSEMDEFRRMFVESPTNEDKIRLDVAVSSPSSGTKSPVGAGRVSPGRASPGPDDKENSVAKELDHQLATSGMNVADIKARARAGLLTAYRAGDLEEMANVMEEKLVSIFLIFSSTT